jgi:hypothetical protein
MADLCANSDQQILGARGGKNPKRAPSTKSPRIAMKGGSRRKPGGGKGKF